MPERFKPSLFEGPQFIEILGEPKIGTNEYGEYFCYRIKHEGKEKEWWASKLMHTQIVEHGSQKYFNVKRFIENGKTFIEVKPAPRDINDIESFIGPKNGPSSPKNGPSTEVKIQR